MRDIKLNRNWITIFAIWTSRKGVEGRVNSGKSAFSHLIKTNIVGLVYDKKELQLIVLLACICCAWGWICVEYVIVLDFFFDSDAIHVQQIICKATPFVQLTNCMAWHGLLVGLIDFVDFVAHAPRAYLADINKWEFFLQLEKLV